MDYSTNIMVLDLLDSHQIDQHRISLKKLANHYKLPYVRRSAAVGEPDSYLDVILSDIQEMRRDCVQAAILAKKFLNKYEAMSGDYALETKKYDELREKLNEMNSEVAQSQLEIRNKEQRIEKLGRQMTEADHIYQQLFIEHNQSKWTIKQLQKEIESIQRFKHKKELKDSIQKNLIHLEISREHQERVNHLESGIQSRDDDIYLITQRIQKLEFKLLHERSTNEKHKLVISQLTFSNEDYMREAEEFRIKQRIAEENAQKYEKEIIQFKMMIANLLKGSKEYPRSRQDSLHTPTPSLGDMIDELDFEQREDSPVMLLVGTKKQKVSQTTFSNYEQRPERKILEVKRCDSAHVRAKENGDVKNVRFCTEISNTHRININSRENQVIEHYTQIRKVGLIVENQCRIDITPDKRLKEMCSVDECCVITARDEEKPTLCRSKEAFYQVSFSETKKREYDMNHEGQLSIHSKEVFKPVLSVKHRNHASLDSSFSKLPSHQGSQISIQSDLAYKPSTTHSEKHFSMHKESKKTDIFSYSSQIPALDVLNPLTLQSKFSISIPSLKTQRPQLDLNTDLSTIIIANPKISSPSLSIEFESNQEIPYNQQQTSPKSIAREFSFMTQTSKSISTSVPMPSIQNQVISSIIPAQTPSTVGYNISPSKEFEIMPKSSNKRHKKKFAQSVLETQVSDDGLPIENPCKQTPVITLDSSILSNHSDSSHGDYSNSLIGYEGKIEMKKRSGTRSGNESCARCIVF